MYAPTCRPSTDKASTLTDLATPPRQQRLSSRSARTTFVAFLATALVASVPSSASASTLTPGVVTNVNSSVWTLAPTPDGSFFVATTGGVDHVSAAGASLGDGMSKGLETPLSMAYRNGRYYVAVANSGSSISRLKVYNANTGDLIAQDSDQVDPARAQIFGQNQFNLRAYPGTNAGTVGFGQDNKIGVLNLDDLSRDPYFAERFMGNSINPTQSGVPSHQWEECVLNGGLAAGTPPPCGIWTGETGPDLGKLNYAIDAALGDGGIYVAEYNADRVTHIATAGNADQPDYKFGSSGSGSGDLMYPFSIVVQPGTGHVFVSEPKLGCPDGWCGNNRISEFTATGSPVASFGYGVATGADQFETCGVSIGVTCRAGLLNHPGFGRLEMSADGSSLYAQVGQSVVRFAVGSGVVPAATDVFRFWSAKSNNAHFYTASATEADHIKATDPNWTYEGVAFRAIPVVSGACSAGTSAVFRFYSPTFQSHFYTANATEADNLKAHDPNWNYEGVTYCAYASQAAGTTALYRFWSPVFGKHFFTADKAEADNVRAVDKNWTYEGIAYYVLPRT